MRFHHISIIANMIVPNIFNEIGNDLSNNRTPPNIASWTVRLSIPQLHGTTYRPHAFADIMPAVSVRSGKILGTIK